MSEVIVVASFTVKPGQEEEARTASEALVAPTHAEEGCILYALHQGVDDPRRLAFVERWASRQQLEAHLESDHIKQWFARVDELFSDRGDIVVYSPVAGGEAKKGSLAEHAGG